MKKNLVLIICLWLISACDFKPGRGRNNETPDKILQLRLKPVVGASYDYRISNETKTEFDADNETPFIDTTLKSRFRFKDNITLADMPEYFYSNSVAMVYPFLRAYINIVTMHANDKQLMLPVLNFVPIGKDLLENTVEIND